MEIQKSLEAFADAQTLMPGGVNSPVRAFKSVGGSPLFIEKASGSFLWDIDGHQYVDFVGSWGPAILGHSHPEVLSAVKKACDHGLSFGAPTLAESGLAKLIMKSVPSIEKLRLVNSGTEACMSALRVARAYTKKSGFIKFTGNYHGHCDFFLVQAGSGALTLGAPDSQGVPKTAVSETHLLPFNEPKLLLECIKAHKDSIGTIILEPIMGNCGFIKPSEEFIEALRVLQREHHICIIFDEVMTGFRVSRGGAQEVLDFKPDLTTLGKVIGGGLPLAAYGGRNELMSLVAPEGQVYQAGTLSGNPIAVAAGTKTLELLSQKNYDQLQKNTKHLMSSFKELAQKSGHKMQSDSLGGMFGFFFTDETIYNFETTHKLNLDAYKQFFSAMLECGYYFAPSAYEAGFLSFEHTTEQIDATISTFEKMISKWK